MLRRKATDRIIRWKKSGAKTALLIDGARQVGKTYIVRDFAHGNYAHYAEVNFIETPMAAQAMAASTTAEELFSRLSIFVNGPLVAGETLVFLDEVQECPNILTAIKFLVDSYPEYDFVLSGSLLGVELKNVRSVPVGYLDSFTMYPLDFEEFCWAKGLPPQILEDARSSFERHVQIDQFVHEKLLALFHEYLVIGGMPAAVTAYLKEFDIQSARIVQQNIIARYREDISKYAGERGVVIKRIYDLLPSELANQNKRFVARDIEGNSHIDRYQNDFAWLAEAGVALPTYNVDEPRPPLLIAKNRSLFKLFCSDIGLLACMCGMDITREMLAGRTDVLYGAIYENAVAQELKAHGFPLFYFKKAGIGELDFLITRSLMQIVPIEVKSGKSYKRHNALSKALSTPNYAIDQAIVLCEDNISTDRKVVYAPIYCVAFLQNE